MNSDPYRPPAETTSASRPPHAMVCFVGFALSSILTVLFVAMFVSGAYQNYQLSTDSDFGWQRIPTYVKWIPLICFGGALVMFFSARNWRRGIIRNALLWFVTSLVLQFALPPVLLMILYRT